MAPLQVGANLVDVEGLLGDRPFRSPHHTTSDAALAVSDPAPLKVAPASNLAVTLFLPDQPVSQLTLHPFADQTNYLVPGNVITAASLDSPSTFFTWDFLKGVDVTADNKAASIVTFGDSITDGAHSTRDANARWPDVLARRLQADKKTANLGVLNQGIGGNRVLHDTTGPSALARFDRDVIAQAGVKYLVLSALSTAFLVYGIGLVASFWLPEPKQEALPE